MNNQNLSLKRALLSLRKTSFVFATSALALSLLWSQSCYGQAASAGTVTKSVRWHPGNYILVWAHTTPNEISATLSDNQKFRGVQKPYYWSDLEKADGYHFEEIGADLQTLRRANKHLVIQLQYKAFGTTADGKPKSCCPANLRGSARAGANNSNSGTYSGTYVTKTGSLDPAIWDPAVTARLRYLYKALGQYLNANANVQALEAVCLSETAVSQDPDSPAMANVMPYNADAYASNLSYGFRELSNDLPHTVVIQYTNFGVGMDVVPRVVQLEKTYGIGLGGPDLDPYGHQGIQAPRGVYQQYMDLAGDQYHPNPIPFGTAVQPEDVGNPPEQTYRFGKNTLHLNYIFWLNKAGYIGQVNRMLSDPSIVSQKDVAGGLDSRYPSSASPYLN